MVSKRKLGSNGPEVSAIGYGAMGLEGYYGSAEENEALASLQHALDTGTTFIDTADAYGNGHNKELIAHAIAERREDAFIANRTVLPKMPLQPASHWIPKPSSAYPSSPLSERP